MQPSPRMPALDAGICTAHDLIIMQHDSGPMHLLQVQSVASTASLLQAAASTCVLNPMHARRQVRSEAAAVHARITAAAGRALARSFRQLSGAWWVAQHDEHAEAARRSCAAFQTCFPGPKAREALTFCHSQVCSRAVR